MNDGISTLVFDKKPRNLVVYTSVIMEQPCITQQVYLQNLASYHPHEVHYESVKSSIGNQSH